MEAQCLLMTLHVAFGIYLLTFRATYRSKHMLIPVYLKLDNNDLK